MQARKSAGERSTLDLKPMSKDTRSPKQEQSVSGSTNWALVQQKFLKKTKMIDSPERAAVKFLRFVYLPIIILL